MNKPRTRHKNIVIYEADKEILIYDLKTNKAFCLNETSAIIYGLCDGENSIADISRSVAETFNQPINDELIWLALDGLKKENLLEDSARFEIDFNGLNRRQVIKKVGLASLIALPIVSSILVPSAAMAASGLLANTVSCSSASQCQSNNCVVNARGGLTCCAAGVGGSFTGVDPGNGTCTPIGTCATTYNATRCCTQMGTVLGTFNCSGVPGLEACSCL